jgi:hypothetical protein
MVHLIYVSQWERLNFQNPKEAKYAELLNFVKVT